MSFKAMRRDLQRRGLIDEAHRLTPTGHEYCDALLARLPNVLAADADGRSRKRWDMRWPHER